MWCGRSQVDEVSLKDSVYMLQVASERGRTGATVPHSGMDER